MLGEVKFNFKDKVALITGGSRGIGKAIAIAFAKAGADIAIVSRKAQDLEAAAKEIEELGVKTLPVAMNTGKSEEVVVGVAKILQFFGKVDILVNNAATNPVMAPLLDIEEWAWDKIMQTNLKGYWLMSREVGKHFKERKCGNIVNIASDVGIKYGPLLGAYAISKAGVIMLSKVLARELAIYNVRVNTIAPGLIKTRFSQVLWDNEFALKRAMEDQAIQRMGMPEDIAPAVLFLASDASGMITGETFIINGGAFA